MQKEEHGEPGVTWRAEMVRRRTVAHRKTKVVRVAMLVAEWDIWGIMNVDLGV